MKGYHVAGPLRIPLTGVGTPCTVETAVFQGSGEAHGCRPVIHGTLRGPDALIELTAFHLHRLGAAQAKVVTFTADGAPWIRARLDRVTAQVGLEPARLVEVLDWCHAVHHLSPALQASGLSPEGRAERYARLRRSLKKGRSDGVIEELEALAAGQPEGAAVWREIGYSAQPSSKKRTQSTAA